MVRRPMIRMLTLVGCVIALLAFLKYRQISAAIAMGEMQGPPPEAVTTVNASEVEWPSLYEVVGTLDPSQGVTISAEDPGKVVQIGFESGARVEKGALLVQMDTSVEVAQLAAAEARVELARKNLKRAQNLRTERANAESELNSSETEFRQALGDADAIRAVIRRKTISAPFAGVAGIRMVNVGQYLLPSQPIVPLQSFDSLYFNFSLPERYVGAAQQGQKLTLQTDAYDGVVFDGTITAVDPQVDTATRNFKLQATVPNSDGKLRPGMFAKATVVCGGSQKVIPLPTTAISYAPYGNSVYVIEKMKDPKGKEYVGARQQFVKLGQSRGDQVAVLEGIKPGEQIVSSGVFKLRPGAAIVVNNSVAPSNTTKPQVSDT